MEIIEAAASVVTLTEVSRLAVELQQRLQEAPSEIDRTLRHVQFVVTQLSALIKVSRASNLMMTSRSPVTCAAMQRQCYHGIAAISTSLASTANVKNSQRIHWDFIGQARAMSLTTELAYLDNSLNVVLKHAQRAARTPL